MENLILQIRKVHFKSKFYLALDSREIKEMTSSWFLKMTILIKCVM